MRTGVTVSSKSNTRNLRDDGVRPGRVARCSQPRGTSRAIGVDRPPSHVGRGRPRWGELPRGEGGRPPRRPWGLRGRPQRGRGPRRAAGQCRRPARAPDSRHFFPQPLGPPDLTASHLRSHTRQGTRGGGGPPTGPSVRPPLRPRPGRRGLDSARLSVPAPPRPTSSVLRDKRGDGDIL